MLYGSWAMGETMTGLFHTPVDFLLLAFLFTGTAFFSDHQVLRFPIISVFPAKLKAIIQFLWMNNQENGKLNFPNWYCIFLNSTA